MSRDVKTGGKQKLLDWRQFLSILDETCQLYMDFTNSFSDPDRQIIEYLLQNNLNKRRGEEILFNRYAYFIRQGMSKHGLSEEEAFNAYSDGVLAVIERISNGMFQGRSSLKTYIYQIFHNKCVDLLRKNAADKNIVNRTESISERLSHLSDKARSVVQILIDKADWNLLKEKLNQLGDDCRKMLLLWADSYSDREIATLMEYKTADVVKTSRLRCLGKLKRLYNTA
ncbi:MAG TPA: sigma-70 family RNA polymerase sigma factor [Puia sp.]